MKIYVICDLEGVAGVVDHRQQCWFDGEYYKQARKLATLELNALVEGALEGGATEIVAWDGHGNFPGGLDVELLHPECKLVMGAGDGGPAGLDASFDAVFQLGLHSMAGTTRAVLSHSFMPDITACWINGLKVGEIGMNCATAGQFGVPTVFISGDRAAVEEARALVPDIEGVIVKEGIASEARGLAQAPMISLSPQKACTLIREGARRAMTKVGTLEPFCIQPPYHVRTEFTEAKFADENAKRPNVKRIDAVTIEVEGADLLSM
ncbi:MAG: M55 family metallopeptidase [Chloroflexi bacterium]|nr:M55 family metallopeptidase [Chloroflexota bacterium]